jgi:hypothetical protein
MDYGLDGGGSIPERCGKVLFFSLFATASRPVALRPTKPPVQWVQRILPLG